MCSASRILNWLHDEHAARSMFEGHTYHPVVVIIAVLVDDNVTTPCKIVATECIGGMLLSIAVACPNVGSQ